MVVQAVSRTTLKKSSDTFALMVPGGGLGDVSSCTSQYPQPPTVWGSQDAGVCSADDCNHLAPELKEGCLWRFGWFSDAQNPNRVNFEQVECPAALTAKSGCCRNDEQLQLASVPTESSSSLPPPTPPTPPPPTFGKSPVSTNVRIAVAACVPLVAILIVVAAYWFLRRRRRELNKMAKTDIKSFVDILPGTPQPELAAQSENADLRTQELYPVYIQEADNKSLHELNATVVHELEITQKFEKTRGSRRSPITTYDKPLPSFPSELQGSVLAKDLGVTPGRDDHKRRR
ncbi:MAG: hypothetical protein Q9171_005307 [Xanthocarpia ochracea]